jgi:hypothetical protein
MDTPDRAAARMRLAAQLVTLAILGWQAWEAFVPEHSRTLARMRVTDTARRASLHLARRAGRHGIAIEAVTGAEQHAAAWYAAARWLAGSAAGMLQRAYDRAREQ